ncbi:MAG: precorrin-6y C5,15-methyltransferase (decarboxylating) subunit CbiE [Planctomycetota bacterium]|nr:MAG: precorrin-6y C5,15-methyltransferase (decarboxylating) subunit CbiE [Planctomycetota bacterium]
MANTAPAPPSATSEKIFIVGVGDDGLAGLTHHARDIIRQAGTLVGPPELIAKVDQGLGTIDGQIRLPVSSDLEEASRAIETAERQPCVVLTSGDPLFYGLARYLCDRLGKERFEVLPHVSSMQLAFARVKESWEEAYLTNLATQPLARVIDKIRSAEKVGVFTSEETPPARLAQALLDAGIDYFTAYVCENLGSPDERVTRGTLQEIAASEFSNLNVLILVRHAGAPDQPTQVSGRRLFGNPDIAFHQNRPTRGLLTPMEVRVIALAEMGLDHASTVWDVGAGTGSVAIEAAQLATDGQVYAIEMDPHDYQLLVENARRFGATNVIPVLGQAPEAWRDLPDPHAIFVGGTGRQVADLVQSAWSRLRPGGYLVANVGSLDNLMAVDQTMRDRAPDRKVVMVSLARSNPQLDMLRLEAMHPSFLFVAHKAQ